jgi:hypothetical protein
MRVIIFIISFVQNWFGQTVAGHGHWTVFGLFQPTDHMALTTGRRRRNRISLDEFVNESFDSRYFFELNEDYHAIRRDTALPTGSQRPLKIGGPFFIRAFLGKLRTIRPPDHIFINTDIRAQQEVCSAA